MGFLDGSAAARSLAARHKNVRYPSVSSAVSPGTYAFHANVFGEEPPQSDAIGRDDAVGHGRSTSA